MLMYKTSTQKQLDECLTAQQGEKDAVYMYGKMAKRVRDEADKKAFTRLAGDEAGHADVFKKYTDKELKPKNAKGVLVPLMYQALGKKTVYPMIAKGEYAAADRYRHMTADFPEVEAVMNDEVRRGGAVMGLLK